MKTEKEQILAIIAEIQEERKAAHIVPNHVLAVEIINRRFHQPQQALNELCAEHSTIRHSLSSHSKAI
jgi:hypothetical protein